MCVRMTSCVCIAAHHYDSGLCWRFTASSLQNLKFPLPAWLILFSMRLQVTGFSKQVHSNANTGTIQTVLLQLIRIAPARMQRPILPITAKVCIDIVLCVYCTWCISRSRVISVDQCGLPAHRYIPRVLGRVVGGRHLILLRNRLPCNMPLCFF